MAAEHDLTISTALARHTRVVRAQLKADAAARFGLVAAPYLVLLGIYATDLHREAVQAGWKPPLVWTAHDGLSLRLLACCELASHLREPVAH